MEKTRYYVELPPFTGRNVPVGEIAKAIAICAARRPLVRLPAATRRSPTATFIKVFR